jgi:Rhodopirellula transposase DDE domain
VLQQIDIPVSANTVARLLHQMNFSLRVHRKQIATNSSPYRDQQFHISARYGLASSGKASPSSASTARNAN